MYSRQYCTFVDCMYCVLRTPRKIGDIPIALPSLNKVFTYLLTLMPPLPTERVCVAAQTLGFYYFCPLYPAKGET